MKKTKKTYGVYHIIEWLALIKVGKATVKVLFSGGAMTTQGVTPATFTTTDPVVQYAIEHSAPFKQGKIKIINTYPTNEDVIVERNRAAKDEADELPTPEQSDASRDEGSDNVEVKEEGELKELTEVSVSCLQDAQDYLQQNCGISSYKVRSRAAAQKAASEHGVKFVGTGFNSTEDDAEAVKE